MTHYRFQHIESAIVAVLAVALYGVVSGLTLPAPASAQTEPLQIHQAQVNAIEVNRQTQKLEDRWAMEKNELAAGYRTLTSEEKMLHKTKAVLEDRIAALQVRKIEAGRKLTEGARIREELQAYLDHVIVRLEEDVERALPFLPRERAKRIDLVKTVLVQPDTSVAEKCRRVMETLKVETEYGYTVEVYQEAIRPDENMADRPIMADILRVGRLALFWRTPDGKSVGHWDRAVSQWTVLPNTYRRHINDAMEMALKRRTIEMVTLPLGRIGTR